MQNVERSLGEITNYINQVLGRRVDDVESFFDIKGTKLSDVAHKVDQHIVQLYATEQNVNGSSDVTLDSNDRIDNDYFEFDEDNPTRVRVKIKGYYIITAKTNCSDRHVTRIKVNGNDVQRSITYSR